jgi:hypothetical protein
MKKIVSKEIARINQNIFLLKKKSASFSLNFILENLDTIKNQKQLENIYKLFNLSNKEKKTSINFLEELIIANKKKKIK